MYFLNPICPAISLKHCLQRCRLYLLICAPNLPHLTHFFTEIPNFLSFGLQYFKNLAFIAGLFSICFKIFRQSLVVILYYFLYVFLILFLIYNVHLEIIFKKVYCLLLCYQVAFSYFSLF